MGGGWRPVMPAGRKKEKNMENKKSMRNICIVAGARPNFIKVAPIVRAIAKARGEGAEMSCSLVYTGRADDPTLEQSLFDDLRIGCPDVCLGVTLVH